MGPPYLALIFVLEWPQLAECQFVTCSVLLVICATASSTLPGTPLLSLPISYLLSCPNSRPLLHPLHPWLLTLMIRHLVSRSMSCCMAVRGKWGHGLRGMAWEKKKCPCTQQILALRHSHVSWCGLSCVRKCISGEENHTGALGFPVQSAERLSGLLAKARGPSQYWHQDRVKE